MTPWEIAKPGSESAHQKALFAWSNMAQRHGFEFAWDEECYRGNFLNKPQTPVPELKWLFTIPNGGARDPITAGRMKAEGVKKGVADIFLPLVKYDSGGMIYAGLWIEMKKEKGRLSSEQIEFANFVGYQGYRFETCFSWIEAAQAIETYLSQ